MIEAAEREGKLKPGGTIVEPTSGNTGFGLAMAAAQKGYRCVFIMPDKMSREKINTLRALGAEVVVCPTNVEPDDPRSYYSVSRRLAEETPNAWKPDQYSNPNNPAAHVATTGPEIWEALGEELDVLVVGVGTGGTVSGITQYLRPKLPNLQVVGADPEGSIYNSDERAAVPRRGRRRGLLARHLRALVRRPLDHRVRPRHLPHHPARRARGGPADRRLVRARGARRDRGRPRAAAGQDRPRDPARTAGGRTCRRSSTTRG